jgi:peptidyl-prolyl cis-trans isomerase C
MASAMSRTVLAVALGAWLLAACNSRSLEERAKEINAATLGPGGLPKEEAARILAKVGDRTITLGDYAAALERMNEFDRMRYQAPEKRRELLNDMIEFELLAIEARRQGLDKTPEVEETTRQVLRDALLADARKGMPGPGEIPATEVRAFYDAQRDNFREPERRRVSAIALKDKAEAEKLLPDAKKASQADWGKLAQKHLEGAKPTPGAPVETAGDLGIVSAPGDPRGDNPRVPPEVRAAVFEIKGEIGTVLDRVVPAGGKFYLVKLAGRTAAHERSFAEAERSIRGKLFQQKIDAREREIEAELKKQFPLSIDEAALAQVQVPGQPNGSAAPSSAPPR